MSFLKNILFLAFLVPNILVAQPRSESKQVIEKLVIYQDSNNKQVFYYAPEGLHLVKDKNGKPSFKFIQMRYTGTKARGDQGKHRFRSLLQFKVAQLLPDKKRKEAIIDSLNNRGYKVSKLSPIALSNIKAILVHTAVITDSTKNYQHGFFENNNVKNTTWKELDFTLRLNNEDAQIFWDNFHGNQPTISVNYSFFAKLNTKKVDDLTVSGSDEFKETMEAHLEENDSSKVQLKESIINADALSINIDTDEWPELIQQIDINEQVPPDYAALDIYCFDFNNEIRPDLYAKRIEIIATGVGGRDVKLRKTFKYNEPEIYAQTLQFINAIKLNEPYRYRITEILHDGNYNKSEWKERTTWNEILDITTKPKNE
ncbi:hypothetical protein [Tenacibaculum xiamenense]|uniref:hypothetical protein n=1 Tax=Tenacibaculum xiamenense TaxID=1261553 RepID=UPI003894CCCC